MNSLGWLVLTAGLLGAQNPEPPVIDTLIESLKDPDVEIRMYAGLALAQMGAPAVEPLLKTLADPDRHARSGAAYALGQLGIDAIPAKSRLVKALKDPERDVRRQAAYALSRLLSVESTATSPSVPPPIFPEMPPK